MDPLVEVSKELDFSNAQLSIGDTGSNKEAPLARKETRAVTAWKLIVLVVLLLSALAVALASYFFLRNSEHERFQADFEANAFKVMEAVGQSLEKTLKSADALAVNVVSFARATNQSWPFVTIPDFALRASKTVAMSDLVFLSLMPLVTAQERTAWERYSIEHDYWLNESVSLQAEFDLYYGPLDMAIGKVPVLWGDFGDIPYNVTRLHLIQWQNYPVINDAGYPAYNYDWLSFAAIEAPMTTLTEQQVVVSEAYLLPDPNDPVDVAETEIWTEWLSGFVQPGEPYDEPASDLYFPIFDQVDQLRSPSSVQNYDPSISNHTVVGTLTGTLFWRGLIEDILPEGTNGVVVVFENPCNPHFTYQINGPNVQYLGRGDLHDPNYDGDRIRSNFFDLQSFFVGSSMYTGPPLDQDFCVWALNVYPSNDMKNHYTTSNPLIFAITVVLVFVFTTAIFLLYDFIVERRQRLVLNTAERSTAVVASLFPQIVRDRLADEVVAKKKRQDNKTTEAGAFLAASRDEDAPVSQDLIAKSAPIASLYEETTVLFADIAGFTQWSSTRTPVHVFTLLETLYGAFDAIAKRRKVFKVETIGDCYVAVTGLPNPQPHHAVIMARFAQDCRSKMRELTNDLESELGTGTALLALRVGIHSGQTTAGVLRGDKSRFQLFGDTVNTAARHESHGEPDRIHVSQQTADLLFKAGKGNWLTQRSDKINAKGKGELQTYWCEPMVAGALSATSSWTGESVADLRSLIAAGVTPQPKQTHAPQLEQTHSDIFYDEQVEC